MELRSYEDRDAAATRRVFERSVQITAATDYTTEQIEAWAPMQIDAAELSAWTAARSAATTIVAVQGLAVVGFADLVKPSLGRALAARVGNPGPADLISSRARGRRD